MWYNSLGFPDAATSPCSFLSMASWEKNQLRLQKTSWRALWTMNHHKPSYQAYLIHHSSPSADGHQLTSWAQTAWVVGKAVGNLRPVGTLFVDLRNPLPRQPAAWARRNGRSTGRNAGLWWVNGLTTVYDMDNGLTMVYISLTLIWLMTLVN